MLFIRGLNNSDTQSPNCVATIGNFDGVHLGHQAVLRQVLKISERRVLPSTVVVFEPQPQEYFQPDKAPPRLTPWREKYCLIRGLGVRQMLCLRFDSALAALSATAFVEEVIVQSLGVRYLVVGDDFRFGKGRQGDFQLLQTLGNRYHFEVAQAECFVLDSQRVSSTRVRQALAEGDLQETRRLLGRHYRLSGRIIHGQKLGRTWGFPTININLHRGASALSGIFLAKVAGLTDAPLYGAAYVSDRALPGAAPAQTSAAKAQLEVHLFDYHEECYGQHVSIELIRKLRDDKRFASVDALRTQIAADVVSAKELITRTEETV